MQIRLNKSMASPCVRRTGFCELSQTPKYPQTFWP